MNRMEVMEQVVGCEACQLVDQCTAPVFMSGGSSSIAVIGEAPGEQEDQQGAPFVGPAGQLMRRLLEAVDIDPTTVSFINTVSCWPRGTPDWEHIDACAKNKQAQLELADPTHVLLVGKVALKAEKRHVELRHGRGRPWRQDGRLFMATYHPAAALRNGNYEPAMEEDLAKFKTLTVTEDWMTLIPQNCTGCVSREVVWFEECGLGWCAVHLPQREQERFDAWMAGVP